MPKSKFTEVPLPMEWITKYPAFCEFLTDFFHHAYGLGEDITGTLDEDNISVEYPGVSGDVTVTGKWTFSTHPLGLDHTKIANIGVNTHAGIDTHIATPLIHFLEASIDHTHISNIGTNTHPQVDTHLADGTVHMTDAEATVIAGVAVTDHKAEVDPHGQYQKESEKGVASGYASLEADIKVKVEELRNPMWIGVSAPDPAEYPVWLDIS